MKKPNMKDWDEPPKLEPMLKDLDKNRIKIESKSRQPGKVNKHLFEKKFPKWNMLMGCIKFNILDKIKNELEYYKLRCGYQLQAMEECCLDKQKVEESINRLGEWYRINYEEKDWQEQDDFEPTPMAMLIKLKEELGLEDE